MALRTVRYLSAKQRLNLLKNAHRNGETMKHDNFLSDGTKELVFEVLDNTPDPQFIAKDALTRLLLGKLKNNTMTFEQLKMLFRLEHNYELTQTTRDKILIAIQGIVGTLFERIKSAFNL